MTTPTTIYRILTRQAWDLARERGAFAGSAHDARDGFIHFSTAAQLAETAAKHYAGQGDLLLLWVNVMPLGHALRWEPARGGALFPHLYAELPISAVMRVATLPLDEQGAHVFPSGVD